MRRVFYVLAVATLDSLEPLPATLLAQAWWDAGRAEPESWGKRTDLVPEPELLLGLQDLFGRKRETTPMDTATRVKVRDTLLDVSRRWCAGILKGGDRKAYLDAARLLGIASETLILAGQVAEGRRHLQDMLAAFPRHRAFAQEMATVRSQSSLLELL